MTVMPCFEAMDLTAAFDFGGSPTIRVPVDCGRFEFSTITGMFFSTAGRMVLGCSTFAPKYASSEASRKEMTFNFLADGAMRGSAVRTPSTSVQI